MNCLNIPAFRTSEPNQTSLKSTLSHRFTGNHISWTAAAGVVVERSWPKALHTVFQTMRRSLGGTFWILEPTIFDGFCVVRPVSQKLECFFPLWNYQIFGPTVDSMETYLKVAPIPKNCSKIVILTGYRVLLVVSLNGWCLVAIASTWNSQIRGKQSNRMWLGGQGLKLTTHVFFHRPLRGLFWFVLWWPFQTLQFV